MQTRTLGDLILLIESLLGGTFNNVSEMRTVLRLINRRLTTAYNTTPMWERYVVVSEPRILSAFKTGDRISGQTSYNDVYYYKYGTLEYDTGKFSDFFTAIDRSKSSQSGVHFTKRSDGKWFWGSGTFTKNLQTGVVTITSNATFSVQQDAEEKDSPLDVLVWSDVTTLGGGTLELEAKNTVLYDESYEEDSSSDSASQKQTIQDFTRIHRKKAFFNDSSTEYDFYVDVDGANVLNSSATDGEVFVTYKKPLTLITHTESGANDDAVRDGYRSSSSTVPGEFFSYIAHSVFADLLRSESQFQDALREEAVAENYLSAELEKLDIIANNNNLNKKFSTHLNRNSR